ncbi:bacteriocin [Candidatus Magnetoovum chiemensis]|nr:bacteriocin [Candidatus Magnetoovum chiemensis]
MSLESAKSFIKKMREDAEFRSKVDAAANDDERRKFVKAAGFDFSKEDLKMISPGVVHKTIEGELSEADLEKVAGGSSAAWTGATAGAAGAGVGAAVAAL